MTLVAACHFDDGLVLLTDSRATWFGPSSTIPQDSLQKLLYLGPRVVFAYAGDVAAAGRLVAELRDRIKADTRKARLRRLAVDVPRIARRAYSTGLVTHGLHFLIAGVDGAGRIMVWHFRSPKFEPEELSSGFLAFGTGAAIRPYLEENLERINREAPNLKSKADALISGVGNALEQAAKPTVGGLFQVLLIGADGIRPMNYGFVDVDPDRPAHAMSMRMKAGTWTQHVHSTKAVVPLAEPHSLVSSGARHVEVLEYEEQVEKAIPRFHLGYLLTCLGIQTTPLSREFDMVFSVAGAREYPTSYRCVIALSFWGSPGTYRLSVRLRSGNHVTTVAEQDVTVQYHAESIEGFIDAALAVPEPGHSYLECYLDGARIGRRAIYFGLLKALPLHLPEHERAREVERLGAEALRARDEELEAKQAPSVDYFLFCMELQWDGHVLKVGHQVLAVFWKEYPLALRANVGVGFRAIQGRHALRIDLVDVFTRESWTVDTATIDAESSTQLIQIQGPAIVNLPGPGFYFLNLVIDDARAASLLFIAEGEKTQYSYVLLPEHAKRVAAGELLVLGKGAYQQTEAKNSS